MQIGFLDIAAAKGLCYYGYRIPGKEKVFGACKPIDLVEGVANGFVIQPFSPEGKAYTIPDIPIDLNSVDRQPSCPQAQIPFCDTARSFYFKHAAILIDSLKAGELEKVVYSRVQRLPFRKRLSLLFDELCEKYPSAYVFCFYTPQTGLWVGASPELLARCDGVRFSTAAIAGTMPTALGGRWSDKNRKEQALVADFIREQLIAAGVEKLGEYSGQREAGPVKHLCTIFDAILREQTDAESLARRLAPTPALSGQPREKAMELIAAHESYRRTYYGGYCGPRENARNFHYWVNLRSMQVDGRECAIFTGGGLMPDSEVESEWIETERKADTLKKLL